MKKISMFLAAMALMVFSANKVSAQEANEAQVNTEAVEAASAADEAEANPLKVETEVPLHQALKTKFIEGGAGFMSLIIICLILGLALSIERILYLSFSRVNTKALVGKIEEALKKGGIEAAKEVCRKTRGPVAKIFFDGLDRYDQGIEALVKRMDYFQERGCSVSDHALEYVMSAPPSL